jgi:hypothetical protein
VFEYNPICEHPFVMLADALLLLIELADRAAELGPAEIRPAYLEQRARIDFAELPIEALESRHLGYRSGVTRDR